MHFARNVEALEHGKSMARAWQEHDIMMRYDAFVSNCFKSASHISQPLFMLRRELDQQQIRASVWQSIQRRQRRNTTSARFFCCCTANFIPWRTTGLGVCVKALKLLDSCFHLFSNCELLWIPSNQARYSVDDLHLRHHYQLAKGFQLEVCPSDPNHWLQGGFYGCYSCSNRPLCKSRNVHPGSVDFGWYQVHPPTMIVYYSNGFTPRSNRPGAQRVIKVIRVDII